MANNNFIVKNGLTVNGSFTANSTAVNASAITATSITTTTNVANIGTAVYIVPNGNVGIGNNAPNAKLQVTGTANVSGNVVIGGITTHNGNVIFGSSGLSANGSFGTANQVLTSNGTGLYWANVAAGAVFVRQTFTANATVNTTFTVTNGYTVDSIDVYKNGVKLIVGTEVTANNGSTVVLATPAVSGTIVDVVGLLSASVYSLNINTFSQSYPFVWTNTHIFNVNVTVNSASMIVGNTTVNAVVNSTGLAVGNSTVNAVVNSTGLIVGNSTVNAVVNSTAFTVANSTVNYSYISPTSTQKANTSFYLNANGSWAAISAPAVSSLDAFRIGII